MTLEYTAEQIRALFFPHQRVEASGDGYWLGFGIIPRKEDDVIFGTTLHLDIVGLRLGGNDPTLDRAEGEQRSYTGYSGDSLRRAATITLEANGSQTAVIFNIEDVKLVDMFQEMAQRIAPIPKDKDDAPSERMDGAPASHGGISIHNSTVTVYGDMSGNDKNIHHDENGSQHDISTTEIRTDDESVPAN